MSDEQIIALKKEKGRLPELIARLKGKEAKNAKENIDLGIKMVEDKESIELFEVLDKYKDIPDEAYKLLSEILVYIYALEKDENME